MHKILKVKDIMRKKFTSIPYESSLKEAAQILHDGGFSGAPVTDKDGNLKGVISEKDLFRALYPSYGQFYEQEEMIPTMGADEMQNWLLDASDKKIKDIIKDPITTVPETPLVQVGALMLARGIHRLPVMENDKMVGIITRRDIYRAIFNFLFDFKK
jgi:CBS domain-containing protein